MQTATSKLSVLKQNLGHLVVNQRNLVPQAAKTLPSPAALRKPQGIGERERGHCPVPRGRGHCPEGQPAPRRASRCWGQAAEELPGAHGQGTALPWLTPPMNVPQLPLAREHGGVGWEEGVKAGEQPGGCTTAQRQDGCGSRSVCAKTNQNKT